MARKARFAIGGLVYHVWNVAAAETVPFHGGPDYETFERTMVEAQARVPLRILSYCLVPQRWHMVVWPAEAGEMAAYFRWLSGTFAMRWRARHEGVAKRVYPVRFKSHPVQPYCVSADYISMVCAYVERLPARLGLIEGDYSDPDDVSSWQWSSLGQQGMGYAEWDDGPRVKLVDLTVKSVDAWRRDLCSSDTRRVALCMRNCSPLGDRAWIRELSRDHGLRRSRRRRSRPQEVRPQEA